MQEYCKLLGARLGQVGETCCLCLVKTESFLIDFRVVPDSGSTRKLAVFSVYYQDVALVEKCIQSVFLVQLYRFCPSVSLPGLQVSDSASAIFRVKIQCNRVLSCWVK